MIVRLHRLRERGWPIPKYQLAFKPALEGELLVSEERDPVFNRHVRIARLKEQHSGSLLCPVLLDVQLVGLTREVMSLSGVERHQDLTIERVEDFAQTWLCWLDAPDSLGQTPSQQNQKPYQNT